eukprot:TRINITY_DN863_c0_g1_i1.p1 TRINITY_DN863_c0_g1~~TRINITY_DN863_c0_g1_i1.p1  ORF type:complete len:544 (-),score=167.94 TRINITY_DN863_c0_g1_i1:67-1698(-)
MTGSNMIVGGNPLDSNIQLFLIQLIIVVAFSRILARLFRYLKQPAVIAEVVAGILLGPSAFGRIPGFVKYIFPPTTTNLLCAYPAVAVGAIPQKASFLPPYGPIDVLSVFANFGLILFMFIIGLELDIDIMKKNLKEGVIISVSCMALPFALGSAVSVLIWNTVGTPPSENVKFSTFLIFISVAMSITAFPVLARILSETRLMDSRVGNLALSAAALNDVLAWILLAVVVAIANAQSSLSALYTFIVLFAYIAFMLVVIRPALMALAKSGFLNSQNGDLSLDVVAVFLLGIFACAWFTQAIGVDVIFGGFVMGVTVPRINRLPERFMKSIEDIVVTLLLPLYFTNSGLKTNIGSLQNGVSWGIVVLVITVACIGKIVAGIFSAKLSAKTTWRESTAIGFLMNCKGLVELIVLNVGLQAGVLNTEVFTIFVLMALVTTFITSPVIHFIYLRKRKQNPPGTKKENEPDFRAMMVVRDTSLIPWVTQALPSLLLSNSNIKAFVVKEISDRPSTYMYTEFHQMLDSFRLIRERGPRGNALINPSIVK